MKPTDSSESLFPKVVGSPSEAEMRDTKPPDCADVDALAAYVKSLVERPHDYGTCVYAMSLAAVAAFEFVASKLGVTGFQASCADMDILRRTRSIERFRIVNYENLLFPQYCDDDHFPTWKQMIADKDIGPWLAEKAKKLLDGPDRGTANVRAHWKMLASRVGAK